MLIKIEVERLFIYVEVRFPIPLSETRAIEYQHLSNMTLLDEHGSEYIKSSFESTDEPSGTELANIQVSRRLQQFIMILLPSHSSSVKKPSQAMGVASR